jgi:hypothetical protein
MVKLSQIFVKPFFLDFLPLRDMDFNQFYQDRIDQFSMRSAELKVKYNRFSIIRLLVFIGGVIALVLLATVLPWLITVVLIPAALFSFSKFINWHQKIQDEQHHYEALTRVNRHEKSCINNDYAMFPNGLTFVDPAHAYTVDLDIFGDYSFFQYINRTATSLGEIRLADYLKSGVDFPEIQLRQKAITELKEKTDWRHHFQASGMTTKDNLSHIRALEAWVAAEPFVLHKTFYRFAPFLTVMSFVAGVVLSIMYSNWYIFFASLVPAALIIRKTHEPISEIHRQTSNAGKILAYYARMIEHIEAETFDSSKLVALRIKFLKNQKQEVTASQAIRRLSYIISQLNVRYNAFSMILSYITLWDLIWVRKLEQWKAAQGERLDDWFESLREIEALASFGNLYFNNPEWTFPTILEDSRLNGVELGHPLIAKKVRVPNDLEMPTQGHIKLVTGSNMAGKSTYLRTVGLNIVLAMAGAPVCAKEFELPRMRVFTSMRTQDALHESTSSFYAELKRLKFIIEEVEARSQSETDVFFLLDEILKGTNSKDRHTGSKALIRQLIKSKGAGIIATHDLELAALEAESAGTVENLCIEVEVDKGKLTFDYKIKPGVSQSFNATQLMKDMGIRISE